MDSLIINIVDTLTKAQVKGVISLHSTSNLITSLKDFLLPVISLLIGFCLSELAIWFRKREDKKKELKCFIKECYKQINQFDHLIYTDLISSAHLGDANAREKINQAHRTMTNIEIEYKNNDWLLNSEGITLFESLVETMNLVYWRTAQIFAFSSLSKTSKIAVADDIKVCTEELNKLREQMKTGIVNFRAFIKEN